jgi:hypothetical protein
MTSEEEEEKISQGMDGYDEQSYIDSLECLQGQTCELDRSAGPWCQTGRCMSEGVDLSQNLRNAVGVMFSELGKVPEKANLESKGRKKANCKPVSKKQRVSKKCTHTNNMEEDFNNDKAQWFGGSGQTNTFLSTGVVKPVTEDDGRGNGDHRKKSECGKSLRSRVKIDGVIGYETVLQAIEAEKNPKLARLKKRLSFVTNSDELKWKQSGKEQIMQRGNSELLVSSKEEQKQVDEHLDVSENQAVVLPVVKSEDTLIKVESVPESNEMLCDDKTIPKQKHTGKRLRRGRSNTEKVLETFACLSAEDISMETNQKLFQCYRLRKWQARSHL